MHSSTVASKVAGIATIYQERKLVPALSVAENVPPGTGVDQVAL